MDEFALAELAELVAAEFPTIVLQVVPELEHADEVRVRTEAGVQLVRLALVFERTFPHILNAQGGHNHRDLFQNVVVVGCLEHACQPRIGGNASHIAASLG